MILITVEATLAPNDLGNAITLFDEQANEVRMMDGCKHYALFRNVAGDGIAILQHWETIEAFDTYKASDIFAKLGQSLRPLMSAIPVTHVARVDNI
jgi:quinol monooxygenase YgiN